MFSSGLEQNGEEEEGIKGFLVDDIVKEWRRGSRLKCSYCKQTYATVGCVGKGCKKSYHLPCGMEKGSLQQFFGEFSSLCETHRPVQSPLVVKREASIRGECGVCLEQLEERPDSGVLWTPCCGGWFHRNCVERMAETAGCHFFKCPLCNNREQFSEEMQQFGIYLPDQDAEWEAGSAYDDQLERHGSCDAVSCLCPGGNQYDEDDTVWEIILCSCCGAQGIHVECGQLRRNKPRWKCSFCREVVARMPNKPVKVFTRVKRRDTSHSVNKFSRNVLGNLSFKISSNEVTIEVFKNKLDTKDPAVATFVVTAVPAADIPYPVKVYKDNLRIKTEDETQRTESEVEIISDVTDEIAACRSKEPVSLDILWPVISSKKCSDPNNQVKSDKLVKNSSSTPSLGSSSKKRRLSAPVGQPSILNFFQSSLSPTEMASPIAGKSKFSQVKSTWPEFSRDTKAPRLAFKNVTDNVKDEIKLFTTEDEENTEIYSCDTCDMKTKFKNNFVRHLRSQHLETFKLKPTTMSAYSHLSMDSGNDASDTEVHCSICKDPVMPGDDYRCHLNFAHDILDVYEVEKYINNDQKRMPDKDADEIKLEDDDTVILDSDEIKLEESLFSLESVVNETSVDEIPCHICEDPVMIGDDYRCHLKFAHDISDTKKVEKYVINAPDNYAENKSDCW